MTNRVHGSSCREIHGSLGLGKQTAVVGLVNWCHVSQKGGKDVLVEEEWMGRPGEGKGESSFADEVVVRGCLARR